MSYEFSLTERNSSLLKTLLGFKIFLILFFRLYFDGDHRWFWTVIFGNSGALYQLDLGDILRWCKKSIIYLFTTSSRCLLRDALGCPCLCILWQFLNTLEGEQLQYSDLKKGRLLKTSVSYFMKCLSTGVILCFKYVPLIRLFSSYL